MFWKVLEFVIRIVYFRRFRSAKKIGMAGALLGDGKPDEAMLLLEKTGRALHESLLPLYAFTRGKILEAQGKLDEAEKAFQTVVLSDPQNARADLELAILTGKQFRLDECRTWLQRAIEKEDEEVRKQALEIRTHLDSIESGQKESEFLNRARQMANKTVLNRTLGNPPDLSLLDQWITESPQEAREALDEIALLVGLGEIESGAAWKLNLAIEDSVIVRADGSKMNPFEFVANRFPSDPSLDK